MGRSSLLLCKSTGVALCDSSERGNTDSQLAQEEAQSVARAAREHRIGRRRAHVGAQDQAPVLGQLEEGEGATRDDRRRLFVRWRWRFFSAAAAGGRRRPRKGTRCVGALSNFKQTVLSDPVSHALAASLDKPALLDVFSRLLSTQPALAPLISTLLPTPSLSTVLATLASLERAVNVATPTGAFVRPEYVWSRVRVPVEEFVTESRRFIGLFVPTQPPLPAAGHTVIIAEEDLSHPSTCFEFLEALTRALLRLETSLPAVPPSPSPAPSSPAFLSSSSSTNPLGAHLVPLTLNAWHTFLTRLATAVQSHGKVLPNSLVQSWFDRLDDLAAESVRDRVFAGGGGGFSSGSGPGAPSAASASAVRRAMQGVRDRAKKELGWLVGLKNVDGLSASLSAGAGAGMEGVEQEEEL